MYVEKLNDFLKCCVDNIRIERLEHAKLQVL